MRAAAFTALLVLAFTGCDRTQGQEPVAEAEEAPARPVTAKDRVAALQTEIRVVTAIERASSEALRKVENTSAETSKAPPSDLLTDETKKFTVLFGGNNHGERNDCGCRKNPLGGLGRRHVMLNALQDDKAAEIWGDAGPAVGPVFHVDAGDMFFANNTLDRVEPERRKVAEYDAESVALALATLPFDALAVGEHDLVLGLEHLQKLTKKSKAPFISANVRGADGELVFPRSVIVERGGVRVAFVGVTKKQTRREDYWSSRNLTVDDPKTAAQDAIKALESHDAVVLLSNLGLVETQDLVIALAKEGTRVHLAVASSTNRMTGDPEFAAGIPVMEPLSRGKYLGRADIWVNGNAVAYKNAASTTPASMRNYRRTVRSYWSTRKQVVRDRLKIAELEMSAETMEASQQAEAPEVVAQLKERRDDSIERQKSRLETLERRLESTSFGLLRALADAKPAEGASAKADDWIAGRVVPVKIEITPHPATRRVLDPREKKRPE